MVSFADWLAGAVVERLERRFPAQFRLNDSARLARDACLATFGGALTPTALADHFLQTRGGQNLAKIGMGGDLGLAAAIDAYAIVPRWDQTQGRVVRG